jgi:hypothetical protein
MTGSAYRYTVYVDDNFHYMDEEERYKLGDFASLDEAMVACKRVVDAFLKDETSLEGPGAERYRQYTNFGPDPFIVSDDPVAEEQRFSAWSYAERRCAEGEEQGRGT